jgi:uncharacterized membrane protein
MPIVVGLFQDESQAQSGVQALLANHLALEPGDLGVVSKRADGELSIVDAAEDRELHQLSTLGRVTGWLFGLVGAVVGSPVTIWQTTSAGDLLASDVALRHDAGLPDEALRHVGEHLRAGSTAVVALANEEETGPITATLEQLGATIYQGQLPPDLS